MKISGRKTFLLLILLSGIIILIFFMHKMPFSNPFQLSINRLLWDLFEPQRYYIKFLEIWPYGGYGWEVYVEEGAPQWYKVVPTKLTSQTSWFSEETVSIEEIFRFIEMECADRNFWKCGVEFNYMYRYPQEIVSYQWAILEVQEFISCDTHPDECTLIAP